MLIAFICEKCGKYNGESNNEYLKEGLKRCVFCKPASNKASEKYKDVQIQNFKPFFSTSTGTVIESKEQRDRIAKEKGWVFGDNKDFENEAKKNMEYNKKKFKREFKEGLADKLHKELIK